MQHTNMNYMLPDVSQTNLTTGYSVGTASTAPYSDLQSKPLYKRRVQFVIVIVAYLAIHLGFSIGLVAYVTSQGSRGLSRTGDSCEMCDLWCSSNCTQVKLSAKISRKTSLIVNEFNVSDENKQTICCFERFDLLSNIYANLTKKDEQAKFRYPEKIFNGIHVKERWEEANEHNWPKPSTAFVYDAPGRTVRVTSGGVYSIHSRVDFRCHSIKRTYNQTIIAGRRNPTTLEDSRVEPHTAPAPRAGPYTSSVDGIVQLEPGDTVTFIVDPVVCTTPRSVVVFSATESEMSIS